MALTPVPGCTSPGRELPLLSQPVSHWSSPSPALCLKASETLLKMRWPQRAALQVVVAVASGNERSGEICNPPKSRKIALITFISMPTVCPAL